VLGKDKKKLAVNLHAKASSYGKRLFCFCGTGYQPVTGGYGREFMGW
jgi:hypothetical protein